MKNKVSEIIKIYGKQFAKEFARINAAIKRYDRIAIFRHSKPDFDALGTQLGLYTWLKDNFPNKEIHFLGDNHVTFTGRIFPETERLNEEWFKKPFLAFIVDTGKSDRVSDPRFKKAKFKIKLDHHPMEENLSQVNIIDTELAAATELVVDMLLNLKGNYILSKEAARYFYIALVGDSGRFMYSSTSDHTFAIAQELIKTGISLPSIYQGMYEKEVSDLRIQAYLLNNYKLSPNGIAYYVLPISIQKEFEITPERGKENVNLFSNIKGINAWCSVTEDPGDDCWRVSIRSKEKAINEVAKKWRGGGHAQASGAKIKDLSQLDALIKDLDDLFVK